MMRKLPLLLVVATVASLAMTAPGSAMSSRNGAVVRSARASIPYGVWKLFNWNGEDGAVGPTIQFDAERPVVFTITDALCSGDQFHLTDGDADLGATSAPASSTCRRPVWISRPAKALESSHFSHGVFGVAMGPHAIEIVAIRSPWGGGSAYYRIDPLRKPMCKDGGWMAFGGAEPQFTNQGECVSLVQSTRPLR